MKQLFCDCKTDDEKSAFFLSGRAVETGVIAQAISNDVAMAYHRCSELKKELEVERMRLAACGVAAFGYFNGCAKEYESASLYDVMELRAKNEELRAKIEEMEKQEPVMWANSSNINSSRINRERGGCGDQHTCSETQTAYHDTQLYTLPGTQNVPEKLCYDSRWEISIDYVDGWNAAVDMMRGKSPSWHCPDCCIAFPFGAPKSCPNDDARCNSLLAAAQEAKP